MCICFSIVTRVFIVIKLSTHNIIHTHVTRTKNCVLFFDWHDRFAVRFVLYRKLKSIVPVRQYISAANITQQV